HTSPSIYVKFPLAGPLPSGFNLACKKSQPISVVIWTTTPWTLPANQAVCLHPDIDYAFVEVKGELFVVAEKLVEAVAKACRWSDYVMLGVKKGRDGFEGLDCRRPFSERRSPITLGEFVTLEQGTGCVHIAPGHGHDDYLLSLKYQSPQCEGLISQPLQIFVPVDDAGRFTDAFMEFAGQHVFKANPGLIEKLKEKGVLLSHRTTTHSYPHCWRCKNPVIFRATEQWFVSMETNQLRAQALNEIDRVRWIPPWGRERIYGMIANRPDWCLSRQRVWGTPIPAFTCTACCHVVNDPSVIEYLVELVAKEGADAWFQKPAVDLMPKGPTCPKCGGRAFEQERDILDVWFESGVSHAAVLKRLGWERKEPWWPADLYLEGSDQHRGWFHSALLSAVTTDGQAPYRSVLTHGFVVDGAGKKMSKSAGNVVTPQEVIKQSGAEILRLWVSAQDYREDLRISPEILNQLVEAYRKIRNTCRFLLSNLYDFDPHVHQVPFEQLPELDRWALLRLGRLIPRVSQAYEEYEFHTIFHELNNFCSVDMSAVYLDILKDRLYTFPKESALRRGSQSVLLEVLKAVTKLMAPILSFTADEIWRMLPESVRKNPNVPSVHLASFPEADPRWGDPALKERWERLLEVRGAVQSALELRRREKLIGSSLEARVLLQAKQPLHGLLSTVDLPSLFIVSQVDLQLVDRIPANDMLMTDPGAGFAVQDVRKASGLKCERCWNYRESVGGSAEHPALCDRCVEAIR
ncbi:MAG: isoleucine--tRNA ligase, partial [Nitrospiraceae bacterium]